MKRPDPYSDRWYDPAPVGERDARAAQVLVVILAVLTAIGLAVLTAGCTDVAAAAADVQQTLDQAEQALEGLPPDHPDRATLEAIVAGARAAKANYETLASKPPEQWLIESGIPYGGLVGVGLLLLRTHLQRKRLATALDQVVPRVDDLVDRVPANVVDLEAWRQHNRQTYTPDTLAEVEKRRRPHHRAAAPAAP